MAVNKNPASSFAPKDISAKSDQTKQRNQLLDALRAYLSEARDNAREWQEKARKSWDMVHGRIDWSHKAKDQSKVHLNRVGLAQEQIKAQIKQGLINFDQWLVVEDEAGFESELMNTSEARRLVIRGIRRTNPKAKISDNIGIAAVENLLATKLQPVVIEKRGPGGAKKKEFHIDHIPLNIRNYYPDAKMGGLYEIHEVEMDKHKVLALASDKPSAQKPYKLAAVKKLQGGVGVRIEEQHEEQDRGIDVKLDKLDRRKPIILHEFWGTVLADNGEVMKWKKDDGSEIELKDVVVTLANESEVIADPKPFPSWDGESYFLKIQLLRTNLNMYGRSLLAPGVDMNRAEDELVNAGIDAGLKEAYNVNVLKVHGLAKREQASGGIRYGATLLQNNQLAPGEKLLETVKTGQVPQGMLSILSIVQSAGAENMRLNELSLSGALQQKQTRATEIIQAQQTIQGLFESLVGDIEDVYIEAYAKKAFNIMLQHANLLSDEDLAYVFYGDEARIASFKSLSPRALFDELSHSFRFRGKGIRSLATNARQAQAIVNLVSMIVANPLMLDVFERRGLDLTRMFDDVLKGFGLDMQKYLSADTAAFALERQLIREEALANAEAQGENLGRPGPGPNAPTGEGPSAAEPGSGAGLTQGAIQ